MLRLLIIIASGLLWPSAAFIRSVSTTSAVHVARPLSAAVQGDLVFTPSYVSTDNSYFNVSAVSFKEDGRYSAQLTYSASYPDVLVPLIGTSINGLCYSKPLLNVQQFPCGMLGFFKKSSSQMWLATTNLQGLSTRVVPLIRPLPFECSDEIPCAIRTAAPMAGEVGGCDLGSYDANVLAGVPSDTLVVVTWNNTRYLFRPLQYFAGVGDIRAVPTGWPAPLLAGLAYDPGLQFWFFLNSDGASGECIMSLINANGTAMIYNSDEDDPSTPTGLQLVASVGPNSTQPASASICQPSVQFLYLSGWGSAVLSLTCRSGEGWLWVYQPDGIPYPISLAGSFSLDPPLHMAEGPLIVDIAFM